jgi:hypothetical protein
MADYSNRPVGGRGRVAQYPTTVVRVPIAIKESIEDLVCRHRDGLTTSRWEEVIEIVQRYADNKKETRDWTVANRLLDELLSLIPE